MSFVPASYTQRSPGERLGRGEPDASSANTARRPIRSLPSDLVAKIAAGEVIERPASAVKELLENAVDAGARSITLEVRDGGRELIRIVDDGKGIPADELPLAVANHATSKIDAVDELFSVRTFGFRGEALASIAGVSHLHLRSRPADQPTGAEIEVEHGAITAVRECGCPPGTQIEVRELFASVPVRRKFLKTRQTEFGHISESLLRTALARPGLALKLIHDDRVVHERPADLPMNETVRQFFGDDVARALLPVEGDGDDIRLHGFVASPSVTRPNARGQYLFVNGRCIRDRSLGHAITEGYRGLVTVGRYPVVLLFLEVPPDSLDVNVHPAKIEVRFRDPHRLYSLLLRTLRERFLRSDMTAHFEARSTKESQPGPPTPRATADHSASPDTGFALQARDGAERRRLFAESLEAARAPQRSAPPAVPTPERAEAHRPAPSVSPFADRPAAARPEPAEADVAPTREAETVTREAAATTEGDSGEETGRHLQIHDSYLVVETAEGMLLIDQHALHERILYERIQARLAGEPLEVQELLVPEPVDLPAGQAGLLLEQGELLATIGLRLEEFGPHCVLVRSVPVLLRRCAPAELLRSLAERLERTGRIPARDELLHEIVSLMACKAAVKAGDPLTPGEIDALLEQRKLAENSHHCPHGRPSVLRFSLRDLERQFHRT